MRPFRVDLFALMILLVLAAPVLADPVPGFLEDFPGTSTQGWGGGSLIDNPGSGGVGGEGDGFLRLTRLAPDRFGSVSFGLEYNGDWIAAGISTLRLWLDDVGADEPFEVHVGIGNGNNFWHSNAGMIPPEQQWSPFTVDLTQASGFTRILGLGTFEDALRNVDRLLVRHDLAPYAQSPNFIQGDLGVDRIELRSEVLRVPPPAGTSLPVGMSPPAPNPSRGPVAVTVVTPAATGVRLEVIDLGGRRVRLAELGAAAAGPRIWMWDGRDQDGRRVPPGAYRVRAIGPGGGVSRPLIRID
jgi:hypothetical protein